MEKPELKACPFCGGAPTVEMGLQATKDIEIRCYECAASTGNYDDWHEVHENLGEAAAAWNRRAPDPVTADLLEALEELHARVAGECGCSLYRDESDADFNLDQRIRRAIAKAKGVG